MVSNRPASGGVLGYAERVAQDKDLLATFGISAIQKHNDDWALTLEVTPRQVNAGGLCHGGFLFALADTALAYTLGAAGMVPATVDASITYLRPALLNDVVSAQIEPLRIGRTQGVVEVRLVRQADGVLLAVFRGTCANLA